MTITESSLGGLEDLGVRRPGATDHLLAVDEFRLGDVIRHAQASGQRVVIDGIAVDGSVSFSLIEQYLAPSADTTENLPPQCSF